MTCAFRLQESIPSMIEMFKLSMDMMESRSSEIKEYE